MDINVQKATIRNAYEIQSLIYYTIDNNFVNIYTEPVILYLKNYHSLQSILEDINKGYCIVAKINNIVTGTGAIVDNYIKSVYVHPSFQRMGIGSLIIKNLEQYSLNNNVKEIIVDATIGSENFYTKLGYKIIELKRWQINDVLHMDYYEIKKIITNE